MDTPEYETWTLRSDRLVLSMVQDDACDLFGLLREPALHRFTGNASPASADVKGGEKTYQRGGANPYH